VSARHSAAGLLQSADVEQYSTTQSGFVEGSVRDERTRVRRDRLLPEASSGGTEEIFRYRRGMKTPRARGAQKVSVSIDPKSKKLWLTLIAAVHAHEKDSAEAWDVEWETVGRILDHKPPLYAFGGYRNAPEFLKKELDVEERVARAYVRVAQHATPQDEIDFGIWKLDAIIGYLEAAHAPLVKSVPIAFDEVKVEGKAATACSIPVILAAKRRALAGGKKKNAPKTEYRDALEKTFSKHDELAHVTVHEAHGEVTFQRVPNAALRTFAELVLEAPLPGVSRPKKRARRLR
jgi:hypothetical protein